MGAYLRTHLLGTHKIGREAWFALRPNSRIIATAAPTDWTGLMLVSVLDVRGGVVPNRIRRRAWGTRRYTWHQMAKERWCRGR